MRKQRLLRTRLGVLLAVVMLATLFVPATTQAITQQSHPPTYTVVIYNSLGANVGTATIQWDAFSQATIQMQVRGFEPIGGDRRVGITNVGFCSLPTFQTAGTEIVHLPNVQFYPDGSANYRVVTTALQPRHVTGANGSAIVIRADVSPHSTIIGCGVIVSLHAPVPTPHPTTVPKPAPTKVPTVAPPAARPVQVNAPIGLRLRQQPRLASSVVLTLAHGEWVTPLAAPVFSDGLSWTRVQVCRAGRCFTGYAATAYLGTAVAPAPTTRAMRVVSPAGLRLRGGPGTSFAIRRIVPNGTILQATGVERTAEGLVWAQVRINGILLWAAKNYLTPA
jgi:hypothetical protein